MCKEWLGTRSPWISLCGRCSFSSTWKVKPTFPVLEKECLPHRLTYVCIGILRGSCTGSPVCSPYLVQIKCLFNSLLYSLQMWQLTGPHITNVHFVNFVIGCTHQLAEGVRLQAGPGHYTAGIKKPPQSFPLDSWCMVWLLGWTISWSGYCLWFCQISLALLLVWIWGPWR